jgi:Mn-dependent DtxR family transcriptional regulator
LGASLAPATFYESEGDTMARKLKEKEMRVLRFVYDYIKNNNCAPTTKEIAKAHSVSTSVANNQVNNLFVYGYLREPEIRGWRNLALTEKGILACEGGE